jgi:myo-inositol-1(or 4)-monophosphatase
MLAAGHLDLVVESQLKPYDIVPLIPVLEGAGCIVTDWRGGPALAGGDVVAAGSREVHGAALAVLGG